LSFIQQYDERDNENIEKWFTGIRDYAILGGVIRERGLCTRNHPPPAETFLFLRTLFEASFGGSFQIKNPACAG